MRVMAKYLVLSCALAGISIAPSSAQYRIGGARRERRVILVQPPPPGKVGGAAQTPAIVDRSGWPSPIADNMKHSYLLFDNLEYRRVEGKNALRWDILGWQGGDYERTWFKSEGLQSAARGAGGEADAQLLRGKLISPYFDLQYGLRVAGRWGEGPGRLRAYGVIGLQGLAPYRFDIEPALFISQQGKISGRFTGTYDVLLSQKLILQPRFETEVALQDDKAFGVGSGLNNTEFGLRLRYEIRREFAPYVGVTWLRRYGGAATLVRREGGDPSQFLGVTGVRMWF